MKALRTLIVAMIACVNLGAGESPKLALVIGNAKYKSDPLRNPVNDATAMSAKLRELGFEVLLELDADDKAMKRAINTFGDRLHAQRGLGLFYFAGHGLQHEGVNYLIPVNARINRPGDIYVEGIDAFRVLKKMEDAGTANIVILDACRNNPYVSKSRSLSRGLASIPAPGGTYIMYAARPGEEADDGSGRLGLFTEALLAELDVPGQRIEELMRGVARRVKKAGARQTPWPEGQLENDFCFRGPCGGGGRTPPPIAREAERLPEMVAVPGGAFLMGCNAKVDSECDADEGALRRVEVGAFRIDRTEVSVRDYARCKSCSREGVDMPFWDGKEQPSSARFCNWGKDRDDHPMNCVTWAQASAYCASLGKRLPSEAEWEKAARGLEGAKYPWGNTGYDALGDRKVANIADQATKRQWPDWSTAERYDDGHAGTAPVGSFPAGRSAFGADDMMGNVWEWVGDWYTEGKYRAIRGGSWRSGPAYARASLRFRFAPGVRLEFVGFRCAGGPDLR